MKCNSRVLTLDVRIQDAHVLVDVAQAHPTGDDVLVHVGRDEAGEAARQAVALLLHLRTTARNRMTILRPLASGGVRAGVPRRFASPGTA